MLDKIDRLQCERIREAKSITVILDAGTKEQLTLIVDQALGHDIRDIRHDIRLAFQNYFNNKHRRKQ